MPKYTFVCDKCSVERSLLCKSDASISCYNCGTSMRRLMPRPLAPEVTETVDPYTNVKWTADNKEKIKERNQDHYWKHEVPRLVNSGKYTLQTMLELGWIWVDDAGKVHTHDKPPGKR